MRTADEYANAATEWVAEMATGSQAGQRALVAAVLCVAAAILEAADLLNQNQPEEAT